jgi:antitoxin component YwqK of YwqJK toxin-antitoxin module
MKNILMGSFIFIISIAGLRGQGKTKKTYDSLHRITSIEYYQNKVLTRLITFYGNGNKKKESNFKNDGKLFGKQIEYYENGNKRLETFIVGIESVPYHFFNDGASEDKFIDVVTCKSISYYLNGKKKAEGYIVNGMRSGYWLFYSKEGDIERSEFYKCLTKDD